MQAGDGVLADMLGAQAPFGQAVLRLDIASGKGDKIVHPLGAAVEFADDELVLAGIHQGGHAAARATAHTAGWLDSQLAAKAFVSGHKGFDGL